MRRPILIVRRPLVVLAAVAVTVSLACSGGAGGCSALSPIPGGRYDGPKTDNAVNIRLSPNGINYLNAHWRDLLETFAPGAQLNLPISCMKQNVSVIGDVYIADQGDASGSGRMDGQCDSKDRPANVNVKITGFDLQPSPPDKIEASLQVEIDTGKIYLSKGCIKGSVEFDSKRSSPSQNDLTAEVKFTIDTRWDKLLAFQVVTPIRGTEICGSAPCIDSDDLGLDDECGCTFCSCYACSAVIDVGDWGPIKGFILDMISPMLQDTIREAIEGQSCQACGSGLPACPTVGNATSSCQNGVCVDDSTSRCVPRFLGVEGRLAPGLMLSGFGIPEDALMDVSVAAGSSVSVDQGINLGTRAGLTSIEVADCVPALPPPQIAPAPVPDFDAEAPLDNEGNPMPYHVGLGISKSFLDLATYHAHQSGTMCIQLSSATVGLLNAGLFKTFLPSLGKLTTRDGKDAPMMIALRPGKAPQVAIGEGTFDPVTKKPVKPLIRLDMPDLTIDFYAMLDDRYVRLFSLTADISLPLSLIFENCSSVTPALGDLQQLITNIRTANSEILAEDPKVLADLIPAVIGLAEPALAGALKPFQLPELGAFKLKVDATKGISQIPGTEAYNHLGIYAELMPVNAQCAVAAPQTIASLARSRIPPASEMRLRGRPLQWPVAVLDVSAVGGEGTAEFAYRVDGGLWTTFLAPNADGQLEVTHPRFLLQGKHIIEVRSRLAEHPYGISDPVEVAFTVDWDAPEISLKADRARGVLEVTAHDTVSRPADLTYAYRIADEPEPSAFGPARVIDLAAVEARGGVEVLVKDEAGNVGRAMYRAPATVSRADLESGASAAGGADAEAVGCSSAGGELFGLWSVLASAGWLWRRRRLRRK
ncbi:MAG: hypothetical protein IRZ16_00750 [Myxococcaceae bacterium]|nr:hypothetical protein [Myxococcaceae bacterium]